MGIRVLPRAPRGIVIANIAAGICAGAVLTSAQRASPGLSWGGERLLMLAAGVLCISWIVLMESVVPRARTLVACVAVFGAVGMATIGVHELVRDTLSEVQGAGEMLTLIVTASVMGAGAALVVLAACRLLAALVYGKPVAQDGKRCWNCGYSSEGSKADVCPECAEKWNLGHPPGRFWRRFGLVRWISRASVVLVAALLTAGVVYLVPHLGDRRRADEFRAWVKQHDGMEVPGTMHAAVSQAFSAIDHPGAILPHTAFGGHMLWVTYDPGAHSSETAMIVRLTVATGTSVDTALYCELDHSQARHVIHRGLPEGLVSVLAERGANIALGVPPGPPVRVAVEGRWFEEERTSGE